MRITIVLDDDLVGKAQEITGIADRVSLIHEALRVLVQHETGAYWSHWAAPCPI
jgi:Arc/MetJ family transcription regulator